LCIYLALSVVWAFLEDSFVCTASGNDPSWVYVTTNGGKLTSQNHVWFALTLKGFVIIVWLKLAGCLECKSLL